MTRATVITDASFCGQTNAGGWAAWVRLDAHPHPIKQAGPFKDRPCSSGEAEILAAINGLFLAYRYGARVILIQSDYTGVGRAIHNGKSKIYTKARNLYFPDAAIRFRHVKGHTDRGEPRYYVNRWCDTNAKLHMKKQRKGETA